MYHAPCYAGRPMSVLRHFKHAQTLHLVAQDLAGRPLIERSGGQHQDVGIVVLPREFGDLGVPGHSGPDTVMPDPIVSAVAPTSAIIAPSAPSRSIR